MLSLVRSRLKKPVYWYFVTFRHKLFVHTYVICNRKASIDLAYLKIEDNVLKVWNCRNSLKLVFFRIQWIKKKSHKNGDCSIKKSLNSSPNCGSFVCLKKPTYYIANILVLCRKNLLSFAETKKKCVKSLDATNCTNHA